MGVNVVAIRSEGSTTYRNFDRDYKLADNDLLLVAGNEQEVFAFFGRSARPDAEGKKLPPYRQYLKRFSSRGRKEE